MVKTKEEIREAKHCWYLKNRESILRKQLLWKKENRELYLQRGLEYRSRHKDKIRLLNKSYREKHQKEKVAYKKVYYNKNKERLINYSIQWNREHPAHRNKINARRRLQIKITGKITRKEWDAIKETAKNMCNICGKADVALTIDHIIPLSKGGTHTVENVQPLCVNCNCKKGTNLWGRGDSPNG